MGNLLASIASIGVPLFNHLVTLPFIYHPYRWGGVPWVAPNWFQLGLITLIANVISMMILGTLSGVMTTKQKCDNYSIISSIRRSIWPTIGFLIGNAGFSVLSSLKGPVLVWLKWMPYASWIVHGIYTFPFVLLLGAIGNNLLRYEICDLPKIIEKEKLSKALKASKASKASKAPKPPRG